MNRKRFCIIFSLCLSFSSAAAVADYATAMYHYQAENYSAAYLEFTRLATLGHKDSQFNIGAMHFRGQGIDLDKREAYAWIALSVEQPGDENREAIRDSILAKLNDVDRAAALKRAETLVALFGDKALQETLIPVYVSNAESAYALDTLEQIPPEYPRAATKIGLSGSVDLEFSVDIHGHVKNYVILDSSNPLFDDAAVDALKKWRFRPLVKNGEPVALVGARTRIYFRIDNDEISEFTEKKQSDQIRELRYKARSDLAQDLYDYAHTAEIIAEAHLSWDEVNRLYFSAAQAGLPAAQYQLALNLIYGKGCEVDPGKAQIWLMYAARAGHSGAQYFLAKELMAGNHFPASIDQAWEWLERAVKARYPQAILEKARLLSTSKDDTKRDGKAALDLVKEVIDDYADKFSVYQVLAASQAEAGDYSAAKKTQERVVRMAKSLQRPLDIELQRLQAYSQKMAWRE